MSLLLLFNQETAGVSNVTFTDQSGINPLPAGITYAVTKPGGLPGQVLSVQTGVVPIGSILPITLLKNLVSDSDLLAVPTYWQVYTTGFSTSTGTGAVEGNSLRVTGSGKNLITDPDNYSYNRTVKYWGMANAGTLTVEAGTGAVEGNSFVQVGTGAPSGYDYPTSRVITTVPGTVMTLSAYIDATNCSGAVPAVALFDPTVNTLYAMATQTNGVSGRVSITFTAPVGVTQMVAILDTNNTTIANGLKLRMSNPQLEVGSSATSYSAGNALNAIDYQIVSVTPGQQYTLSGYINASNATLSGAIWAIYSVASGTIVAQQAYAFQPAGSSGRVSTTWTAPAGMTQVAIVAAAGGSQVVNGQPMDFSNPQFEFGPSATTYFPIFQTGLNTISFTGVRAPAKSYTFTPNANNGSVSLAGYASPSVSQAGFVQSQTLPSLPRDWFSTAATSQGGVAYSLLWMASWLANQIVLQVQQVFLLQRLSTATGNDIDSYVQDFLGFNLPRLQGGETDAAYATRAKANLGAKKGTKAGVLAVAQSYGTAWVNEAFLGAELGSYDTGYAGYDTFGGYGTSNYPWVPSLNVFVTPSVAQTNAQAQAMKANILSAKPAGMSMQVYSVTAGVGTLL